MPTFRIVRVASLAAATTLALAVVAPAADAPKPVVALTASISPSRGHIKPGTPLTLNVDTTFKSVPAGGNFVLQRLDYLLPQGAVQNGKLFPSCTVEKLARAHGQLSACPKGSKVGSGTAYGTAVAIGVSSSGRLTLFNGPGGKSLTMNLNVTTPALINATFSTPLVKTSGRYGYKLSATIPDQLKTILGGDIVVSRIDVTAGATRIVHGVKRGYIEGVKCPKSHKAPVHADFVFNQGAKASADTTIAACT
jgi:hypothetical protein